MQIRIKALDVKKGCPAKTGRFYLRIFFAEHILGVAVRAYFPLADVAVEFASFKHPAHIGDHLYLRV